MLATSESARHGTANSGSPGFLSNMKFNTPTAPYVTAAAGTTLSTDARRAKAQGASMNTVVPGPAGRMNPEWTCPNCNRQGFACHITQCECGQLTPTGHTRKVATSEKAKIRTNNIDRNRGNQYRPSTDERHGARNHWSHLSSPNGAHCDCELTYNRNNLFCFAPTDHPAHFKVVRKCELLGVPLMAFPVSSKVVVQNGVAVDLTLERYAN